MGIGMVDYKKEFRLELANIEKLIATPELIRSLALSALLPLQNKSALSSPVNNAIAALENISTSNIAANYEIIYNQVCVLAVSALSAALEKYFVNYANYNWQQIDTSQSDIRFKLEDLAEHGFNLRPSIGSIIKSKDNRINFQDLQSTKRTFEKLLRKTINLSPEVERKIIFYQQARHVIVHNSGFVDDDFVKKCGSNNFKAYKLGNKVQLDEEDWKSIKSSFEAIIEEYTKHQEANL